jgi:hypothetical protein
MAFDVSGLTAYIEEQNFPLITKAVTGGRTASLMEKQVGVKGKTKINLMDVDVNFQDGSGCAFNADGDVTFTQREIDPAKLKLNMEFCPKTLEGYYLRSQLPSGAHYESIPFEEQFGAYLVEKIQSELEVMIWQSDSTLVSGNLQFFDGLIDVIGGGSLHQCKYNCIRFGNCSYYCIDCKQHGRGCSASLRSGCCCYR